ncbi:MAG: hypothetical protein ACTSR8_13975 [Promethearchaeota archaeon]
MYITITIILIIGYIFVLALSSLTLLSIIINYRKFGTKLMMVIAFIIIFNSAFIYSTLYVFSIIVYFNPEFNALLWRFSVISGFISIILVAILYSFLLDYKNIHLLPFLFFITLFGLLIGIIHWPNSVLYNITIKAEHLELITDIDKVNYIFNFQYALIITILQISILIYLFIISYQIYVNSRKKDVSLGIFLNTIIFSPSILFYILYLYLPIPILRDLHLILLWVCLMCVCYMMRKKPETLLLLTNRISYLNIYHKSGVELYSYKFEKDQNEADSQIWGKILIGLNHILSEFINKEDQINVLQTKNSDIIVNYDELGFAVMVITNQKNAILKKIMQQFTSEFKKRFMLELTEIYDLNRLINVADFKDTKHIIEEIFSMYL